jgi:hypothetical protein
MGNKVRRFKDKAVPQAGPVAAMRAAAPELLSQRMMSADDMEAASRAYLREIEAAAKAMTANGWEQDRSVGLVEAVALAAYTETVVPGVFAEGTLIDAVLESEALTLLLGMAILYSFGHGYATAKGAL